ncbi:hypothetical protein [Thermococcus sp. ES12]|uniref:hypothetical protein n=1 Tax=Thermococcus sp. ES12 TaxID=1638246 RepID=UPI0014303B7F|nr:hypothetical protein [Thermococcus sp. ES12]NJE77041.1 hypothetical protein [Thermococcus sp. ES12]
MEKRHDALEAVGAIVVGLGLVLMFATYGAGLFAGALLMGIGLVVWKMGEMRREFNGKLESLRMELESLKGQGDAADG